MNEELIKTGVDELLELLKNSPKMALADVAKSLNVSMDVVQAWIDFLVEEGIVGIEYKFTTPFVYINKPLVTKPTIQGTDNAADTSVHIARFKGEFWERAIKNNIPKTKIEDLWKNRLLQELANKKKYFYFEAQNRKLNNIDLLWDEYVRQVLSK